ncbi:MAG: cation transporter [Spirulinaceae cyanobacterium RM2_2_10]|nr:cation transporter [Spirulinaceae cyanobacterium RM2_2_10]
MSDCGCQLEAKNAAQRRVLGLLLVVNAAMFVLEVTTGVLAQSTALIADSLDMLADATVYGISLSVVGRSAVDKTRAAFLSGVFQITLASLVLLDVIRKFISGSRPESALMMGIGFIALTANVLCLWLLAKHRHGEVHMRASWIFSKNDVIANLSVIGGGSVWSNVFQSRLPDLVIGLAIAILVLRGGIQILRAARGEQAVS